MRSRSISFVVPARDEEQLIGRTLRSLHESACQLNLSYEIIVVDDGSTDRTVAIASELGARVIRVNHHQIARARNAGAHVATQPWLVFIDADTTVPAVTLAATIGALRAGCVGGGALFRAGGPLPLYARLAVHAIALAMRAGRFAAGCYLFCTRSAFDAAGGFDETLFATEELALSRALRRCGRFVVLRQRVETSGRKFRTHSAAEMIAPLWQLIRHGTGSWRDRERLPVWYGPRRPDDIEPVPSVRGPE